MDTDKPAEDKADSSAALLHRQGTHQPAVRSGSVCILPCSPLMDLRARASPC